MERLNTFGDVAQDLIILIKDYDSKDGVITSTQHVAGNLLNFVSWLVFHTPEVAIASWVGENDEDTTNDWALIENNKYTQEDLYKMVNSALRLTCALKSHTAEESGGA